MIEGNHLEVRVGRVEERLGELTASVEARFDAVDVAFAGQRQFTEFAFDRLSTEMKAGFSNVDGRFNRLEGRLDTLEGRFDILEGRFDILERRFDTLERRFDTLEVKLDKVIDYIFRR